MDNKEELDLSYLLLITVVFIFIMIVMMSSTGCSNSEAPMFVSPSNGRNTLISTTIATTTQCSTGGTVISYGLDTNRNNLLDVTEVRGSTVVCNGSIGATGAIGDVGQPGRDGSSCTVTAMTGGALVSCSDGSTQFIADGNTGPAGPQGMPGNNGVSIVTATLPATTTQCPDSTGTIILLASDTLGTGVYSTLDSGQQSITVCNGKDGMPGQDAPVTQYGIVKPIEPCGASSSPYKEVLLCLSDGSLLADFSKTMGGDDTRLSFISPGSSYIDTDESGCNFSVTSNTHGDSIVSWSAGHNKYATWTNGSVTCEVQ